eukprot:scaffold2782_cov182-Amphora_coffeaeformis.AAC.22
MFCTKSRFLGPIWIGEQFTTDQISEVGCEQSALYHTDVNLLYFDLSRIVNTPCLSEALSADKRGWSRRASLLGHHSTTAQLNLENIINGRGHHGAGQCGVERVLTKYRDKIDPELLAAKMSSRLRDNTVSTLTKAPDGSASLQRDRPQGRFQPIGCQETSVISSPNNDCVTESALKFWEGGGKARTSVSKGPRDKICPSCQLTLPIDGSDSSPLSTDGRVLVTHSLSIMSSVVSTWPRQLHRTSASQEINRVPQVPQIHSWEQLYHPRRHQGLSTIE